MIRTFRNKMTAAVFTGRAVKALPPSIHKRVREKLDLLDHAQTLGDLRVPPGNELEKLTGDRNGQWSIRVNRQWRVCFDWLDGDAWNVEIADYH
jgi:proteic killer suppression protein